VKLAFGVVEHGDGLTFSQAKPRAIMPQKLSIQYTTKVPVPYAIGLPETMLAEYRACIAVHVPNSIIVTCVSDVTGFVFVKLIWNARETKLYASDRKKYAVTVAAHRQAMSWGNLRGG
jgi:hypothetical protein